ncbi:MAG: choice-of-anchor D domain-containing protein [Spirochaetales bacterium]|nr:choice-of-anchor D domain-containing protein [Spirochaetales bacterium]
MKQRSIRFVFLVVLLISSGLLFFGCDGFLSVEIPPRDNPEDPLAESPEGTAAISINLQGVEYSPGSSYDFGDIAPGSNPPELTFSITNNGTSTLYLTGDNPISFSGITPSAFNTAGPLSQAINPGSSTTFNLVFSSVTSSGAYTAVLTINNNTSDFTLNLSANVLNSTGSPPPTPATLRIGIITLTSLQVDWTEAEGAASYILYRSGTLEGSYSEVYSGSLTEYNDTELTSGTAYYYKVSAVNIDGASPLSDAATGTTGALPDIPQNLRIIGITNSSLELAWDTAAGSTTYYLYRSENETGPFTNEVHSGSELSYLDSGLTEGSPYYYKVKSENIYGESLLSDVISGTPGNLPATPSNLRVTGMTGTSVDLAWDAVSGVENYNLTRSTSSDGTYVSIYKGVQLTYQDTGLIENTEYFYKIEAENTYGTGVSSSYLSVTTSVPEIYVYYGVKPSETEVVHESSYDFGSIGSDNSAYYDFSVGPIVFTLENLATASADLLITGIEITGTNAGEYSLVETLPASLAVGDSDTFTIEFDPVSYGALNNASLTITTNDPNYPSFSILLEGIGEEPSLGGTITDGSNPVSSAYLRLYNAGETIDEYAATDAAGYYEFFDIPDGNYYLVVERDGFVPYTQEVTIP